jgi:hypothetical protein
MFKGYPARACSIGESGFRDPWNGKSAWSRRSGKLREGLLSYSQGQGPGKVVQLLVRIALGDPKVVRGCLILGWSAHPECPQGTPLPDTTPIGARLPATVTRTKIGECRNHHFQPT